MRADILEAGSQWMAKHRGTEDSKVLAKIVDRVEELLEKLSVYVSPSLFERSYLELVSEGVISPFRGSMESKLAESAGSIPQDVINYIESAGARELARRYKSDAAFRRDYDLYEKRQAEPSATLTVEEYRKLPAREVARRYGTDRVFKAAVDALISRGLI